MQLLVLMVAIFGLAAIDEYRNTSLPEDAIALAKSALEEKVAIPASRIRIAYATAAEWSDSSLGCPEKGITYQPAVTPGYIVSLQVNDQIYTVHVSGKAAVICHRAISLGGSASGARIEQALKPLNAAREDLATRLKVQPTQVNVTTIKRKIWADTSLGCPKPGKRYAQIENPGFVIELEQGGKDYRYHTGMNKVMLCQDFATTGDNGETEPLKDGN